MLCDIADGHARADRRANEAQTDEPGEEKEAPRAARAHQGLQDPRIFSTVICCTQLLVHLSPAINRNTATILYLFIIKHHDENIFPAALSVLTPLYKDNLSFAAFAVAILATDAFSLVAFVSFSVILFFKPCDVYTFAVIVSVLFRLFIVSVRLIVTFY